MADTFSLETPEATLVYDVRGPLPPAAGLPPLMLVGHPMDASGFGALASHFPDRTIVTYDPRGLGRSTRRDGRTERTPEQNAEDIHRIIDALGVGPVGMSDGQDGPPPPDAVAAPDVAAIRGSELFEEPVVRRYLWSRSYSADEYLALLSTYSGHIAASQQPPEHLFADIRRRIETRPAASVRKHYLNLLQVAQRLA